VSPGRHQRTFVEKWTEAIWAADDLTPTQKLVALAHATFADFQTGRDCYPGENRITAMTGLGRTSVIAARNVLEESGWLKASSRGGRRGSNRATWYSLTIPTRSPGERVTRPRGERVPVHLTGSTRPPSEHHHPQTRAEAAPSAPGGASAPPAQGNEELCELHGPGELIDRRYPGQRCPGCGLMDVDTIVPFVKAYADHNWGATVHDVLQAVHREHYSGEDIVAVMDVMRAEWSWITDGNTPATEMLREPESEAPSTEDWAEVDWVNHPDLLEALSSWLQIHDYDGSKIKDAIEMLRDGFAPDLAVAKAQRRLMKRFPEMSTMNRSATFLWQDVIPLLKGQAT